MPVEDLSSPVSVGDTDPSASSEALGGRDAALQRQQAGRTPVGGMAAWASSVFASVPTRSNHRLSYRYCGHYEVEAKIGSVAYKLKQPPNSTIHPVFHVSLPKKVTGMTDSTAIPLPPEVAPVQILEVALDHRVSTKFNRLHHQLLIKWEGLPPELATWEDEDELLQRFPTFMAWYQAASKGRGDVAEVGTSPEKPGGPRRKRIRKPNTKIATPEWTK